MDKAREAALKSRSRATRVAGLDGTALGRVASLMETGGTPVLCIATEAGEVLVPLAERYLSRVDVAGRRLVLDLSEWGDAAD